MWRAVVVLSTMLSVVGCGEAPETVETEYREKEQALCAPPNFNHGVNPAANYVGSEGTYTYYAYVGANYDHCNGSFPFVLNFHGGGMTAYSFVNKPFMADVMAWADSVGAVLIYPDAETNTANPTDNKWNAGHCCSTAVDHVTMISELGQYLLGEFVVDPDRIHAIGFSNGGAFAMHVAHSLPTTFASIATIAGWSGTFSRPSQPGCWNPYDPTCNFTAGYAWGSVPPPAHDFAVFMIRGSHDKVVPPNGFPVPWYQFFAGGDDVLITPAFNNPYQAGETDFELWSASTGCQNTSVTNYAGVGDRHLCKDGGKKVRHDIVFEMKHGNGGNAGHYMPTLASTAGTYDGPAQVTDFLWNNPR